MKKRIIASTLLAVMVISMIGCGKKEETEATQSTVAETETETPEPETYKAIGTEKESDTVYCVKLKNNTGKDISGVSVKTTEETEFPKNMLKDNDVYVKGEERNLYYEVTEEEKEAETDGEEKTEESEEKLLTLGYDVQITFDDGTSKVLHGFPFDDIKEGEICLEDEVIFLKYKNVSAGSEVSTKEAELAIWEAEKAAETAETEAAEEWYEENYEENYEDNTWNDGGYYEEEYNSYDNGNYYEAPAAPAQNPEECLGGDALTY